jgi:hypothetical protein
MTATAKTEKPANYTAEQTAELLAAYNAVREGTEEARVAVVEAFAKKFGKNVRSIRAKLTVAGVYIAKQYTNKNGEKPMDKEEWADAIGKFIPGMSESEVTSLTKANKTALRKIVEVLAASKPIGD